MLYLTAFVLFFGLHSLPFCPKVRNRITALVGETPYKLLFSIVTFAAIALGIWGWNDFSTIYFYEPPLVLKQLHLLIMFVAVYLWIAAEVPNNIKRLTRHPMLMGINLWAFGHLLANGDLRSMLLFISFLSYSLLAIVLSNRRNKDPEFTPVPLYCDAAVLAASLIAYGALVYFHGNLFGVAVLPYYSGV